jgi:trigger factor
LKTSVEKLDISTVKLSVVVSPEEVDKQIDEAYTRMTKKVKIPGFRQGKAPKPMIDSHVGKDTILAEAQDLILTDSYGEALDSEGLRPIAQPEIGEIPTVVPGQEFQYEAEVQVRPQMTLSSIEGLKVEIPSGTATEQDIDDRVEEYRDRFATTEPVSDRPVGEADFVLISFLGKLDGEEYEGNAVDKYLYEMGKGLMPDEFEEAILGSEPGTSVTAEFVIPESSSNPDFAGKNATFDIEIHEVQGKVLPDVDEDFASNAGYDSVEDMRAELRKEIDQSKSFERSRALEDGVRAALAERLEDEVPAAMVESTKAAMFRDFNANLEANETNLQDYMQQTGTHLADIEEELEKRAEASVAQELALEALAREQGYEVTDEDVDETLKDFVNVGDSVDELREKWQSAGVIEALHEQILQKKAIEWLTDSENVEFVDLAEQPESDSGDATEEE